jgi:hypothetical protein
MTNTRFDFDLKTQKKAVFGLFSDLHIDSPGCDWPKLKRDLDSVANEGGRIFINGDLVDGIYPTDRKRYARSHNNLDDDAQINCTVNLLVEKLTPYADYIDYIGFGNHEVSIVKFNNIDILSLIIFELNKKRSQKLRPIVRGDYTGFINLVFSFAAGKVRRFVIYRDHGKGGNSPVTKGTIGLQRLYGTFDADLYWLGHSHQSIIDPASQWTIGITPKGKLYKKNKIGIITPGYQSCFNESKSDYYRLNFPEERFYSPTGIGYGRLELSIGDTIIPSLAIL